LFAAESARLESEYVYGFDRRDGLALVHHELLTGDLPQRCRGGWLPLRRGRRSGFDLSRLPQSDRPAVARALHDDPGQRFGSCGELVAALSG
jgi:hypothetical protein